MKEIKINTEYITLGQLLKITGIASSGGIVKLLLQEIPIFVNDNPEQRRGRKLYPKDIVKITGKGTYIIQ